MQIYLIDLLFLLELCQVDQQAEKQVAQKLLTGGLWTYQLNAAVSSSAPLSSDKRRPSGVKSWYVQTLYVK